MAWQQILANNLGEFALLVAFFGWLAWKQRSSSGATPSVNVEVGKAEGQVGNSSGAHALEECPVAADLGEVLSGLRTTTRELQANGARQTDILERLERRVDTAVMNTTILRERVAPGTGQGGTG